MPLIQHLKKEEMQEILVFCDHIQEYGHIFHLDPKLLDAPFKKILEGMAEVMALMEESWDM